MNLKTFSLVALSLTGLTVGALAYGEENLALNKKVTTSSSVPEYDGSKIVDNIIGEGQNYWCTDKDQGKNSWVDIDLGAKKNISNITIFFRPHGAKMLFTPKTITIQLSDDDKNWKTIVDKSSNTPAEGATFTQNGNSSFPVKDSARYVKISFPDGSDDHTAGLDLVEIGEVQIFGN